MSERVTDALREYAVASAADPMPDARSPEWGAWWRRSLGRQGAVRYALRRAEYDDRLAAEERQRQDANDDAEVARLCEAEVFPA